MTSLLHSGVDKQTVAELVGHADTGFLERTYCHPQQEQKEQAAGAMRAMIRPEAKPCSTWPPRVQPNPAAPDCCFVEIVSPKFE